ncbi:hypothetical protein ACDL92_03605 [Ihubacter sp. mB4P-1]|uniref:hypothetical protein n=1 Tax=Ihubacter sp. mB4P-1 TaxID=3242370 RepID=UPI003C7CFA77
MAKYSFEFKKHAVQSYLNSEGSYAFLAKRFGMPRTGISESGLIPIRYFVMSVGITNPVTITKWVNDFRIAGPDALRTKNKGETRMDESCPIQAQSLGCIKLARQPKLSR